MVSSGVRFDADLVRGTLLRRYKRFLADVELPDGRQIVGHCPNTGSMKNCAPDGAAVWLSRSDSPRRKYAHTWELVEVDGAMICINTNRANQVVAEALSAGVVSELRDYRKIRREVSVGEKSRIDFLLEGDGDGDGARCYVEVKSVTLGCGDGISAFPDAVTERGLRHLNELANLVSHGDRAVMLFCCGRSDTRRVRPADEIDAAYSRRLREVAQKGVEVLAYRCDVDPTQVTLRQPVPVDL